MKDCTIQITWNKSRHNYIFNINGSQAYKLVTYLKKLTSRTEPNEPRGTLAGFMED